MGNFEEFDPSPAKIDMHQQRAQVALDFKSPQTKTMMAPPSGKPKNFKGNILVSPQAISDRGGDNYHHYSSQQTPHNQQRIMASLAEQLMQQINLLGHGY